MPEAPRLVDLVQTRIDEFLVDRGSILRSISDDLAPLGAFSERFLSGGKRFRARFCYWGWNAVDGARDQPVDAARTLFPVVSAAAALEVFHAAALVHDDLMDNSDTRRGAPSAHRRFEAVHRGSGWAGSAEDYGRSAALLLGDLLLGWSDELLDEGLATLADHHAAAGARAEFIRMRTDVTAGQYLDILEERAWLRRSEAEQRERAERIVVFKSAKYSIESPLALGGSIAGATAEQLSTLRGFGLPLGIAFQLRDDLLGVYGDPDVTGKPAGDDLREGKRTVLIAIARERLAPGQRRLLDELLGDPALDDDQVGMLQQTIRDCGAVDELESVIAGHVERAVARLDDAPLGHDALRELRALADSVTRRAS